MRYGVQLYTLRKDLQQQENFPAVFERVKKMGAESVQVSATGPFDSKFLGKLAKDLDLHICATHSKFERIQNDLDKLAEEHLDFGCPQIGIGMLPAQFDKKSYDDICRFADILNETGEKLQAYNLNIAYHNHWFEFSKIQGEQTMFDVLLAKTAPHVNFILDSYWIKVGGEDPATYIDRFAGRIRVLHLKDYKKRFFVPLIKPLGKGTLDFPAILEHAKAAGVTDAVVELDISRKPYQDLETSIHYLNNLH